MFREVMSSLWWQEHGLGLVLGPGGFEGPEGLFQPLGWMLVFCVRIEVVGSLWWLMQDIGLGFGL